MTKEKQYKQIENNQQILSDSSSSYGLRTYVSLFSSAGVGCYGFKEEGFYCVATVELLERRLKIQKYNKKCVYPSGYICGDMTENVTKKKIFTELELWNSQFNIKDLDVLIATPPCQGMSVANHKKKDELTRNSLVVESIKMTVRIKPKFFIFENVRAFLTSICTDVDGKEKKIKETIESNLSGEYNIIYKVINFKDYGNLSSRTRTIVLGVRKDIHETTPYDLFPDKSKERTLREVIGHLPSLKKMGEFWSEDIYHNFRRYAPHMQKWIENLNEGESAFDNEDTLKRPHRVIDGQIVFNARKNGDKYTRQYWDKVAPCIHTRNDIMASQNTVHPCDDRVFSIRELMLMMSIPTSFLWSDIPIDNLNKLSDKAKQDFMKKEELNIRQNIGEAVPTIIFRQIAHKIKRILSKPKSFDSNIKNVIRINSLDKIENIIPFMKRSNRPFCQLAKIAELANAQRDENAAYYTRQDICFCVVEKLPDFNKKSKLTILEPSIGVGNFLPTLLKKYEHIPNLVIDVVDIDPKSITVLKVLVEKLKLPESVTINYICADFLLYNFDKEYDIIVGNPPYKKMRKSDSFLTAYKKNIYNNDTNNMFSFFIEKSIKIGHYVSLIVPKSLINTPEFNKTRELMDSYNISHIIDFGEKAFKGVKIETINFTINTKKNKTNTIVESYITNKNRKKSQAYITDSKFPYWLIYRNEKFDIIANGLIFDVFKSYRDRKITKAITKETGKFRVLKSRNIGNNTVVNINNYDTYVDDISDLDVRKYLNHTKCVLLPNLTYNPRACFLPEGCIADGSVAILSLKNEKVKVSSKDLSFYSTEKFKYFYSIARNLGTRSLNIDNNSVFFFGLLKK